jgi:hypothetical protein
MGKGAKSKGGNVDKRKREQENEIIPAPEAKQVCRGET